MAQGPGNSLADDLIGGALFLTQLGGFVARRLFDECLLPPMSPIPLPGDPHRVTRYRDDVLDPLREKCDPPADDLMKTIARSGGNSLDDRKAAVRAFLTTLRKDRLFTLRSYRDAPYFGELSDWNDQFGAVPDGLDRERLLNAAKLFEKHFFRIGVVLGTASLLEAYACRKGVQALTRTGELSRQPNRRLVETLQLVIYVNSREGFKGDGQVAANAIRKIRLMHAGVRLMLSSRSDWVKADFGLPINQEDLLGTLMCFSQVVLNGLPKLAAWVAPAQADDYLYLWNAAGAMLGVPTNLLPVDRAEAENLIMTIRRRQQKTSPQGIYMSDKLLDYHRFFVRPFMPVVIWIIHSLIGDDVCRMLQIQDVAGEGVLRLDEVRDVAKQWGYKLLDHGDVVVNGMRVRRYYFPPSIRRHWATLDTQDF